MAAYALAVPFDASDVKSFTPVTAAGRSLPAWSRNPIKTGPFAVQPGGTLPRRAPRARAQEAAMPFGICERCDTCYVLDNERPPLPRCHNCRQPVRLATREEGMARFHRLQA